MKQEELDSLYVEERRIIERLERENKELKASAAGARAGRDSDVAAAQAEAKRLKEQCEELRDAVRRGGRLASEQLERQRLAYQGQLDESAQECEEQRRRCAEAELELGVERSRADSLERKLGEARRALESAPSAASGVENEMALRQQLSAALLRADMSEEAAGKASRRVEAVEKEAVAASEAARKEMQRLSDGLEVAEAAARRSADEMSEEVRRRKALEARMASEMVSVQRSHYAATHSHNCSAHSHNTARRSYNAARTHSHQSRTSTLTPLPSHTNTHAGRGEEGVKRGDRAAKGRDTKIEWAAGGGEACR